MAYCQIFEHPDLTPEKMEQVMAHVRTTGPVLPEGARLLVAGPGDPGMRVISSRFCPKAHGCWWRVPATQECA